MRSMLAASAALVVLLLSGCASIVSGTIQPISVNTPGCEGASCQLTNDKGSWFVKSPGYVSVSRAYGNLTVLCSKEGFGSATTTVASTTKGMAFGNILLGGVIGAGVDIGTGAAYDYPVTINVPMVCSAGAKVATIDSTIAPPTPKTRSRVGVRVEDVSRALATSLGLNDVAGAVVTSVQAGSPADTAGLRVGDVIREFEGAKVSDANDLAAKLLATKDGKTVISKILSNGRPATIQIKLRLSDEL